MPEEDMLIALLAVLGVDLIVIVAIAAFVLGRHRWVKRRDGAFRGAIRVESGQLDGLGEKWRRGYGRWVRDVLVWTNGPLLLSNHIMAADAVDEERVASLEQVKRLGDDPVAATLRIGVATAQVATQHEDRELLLPQHRKPLSAR
jgi:hypothetical protein